MEASTKSNVSQAMMLALTKSYNAYMIFKKCQVDVSILIDPTHSREEFEESITTKMDSHLSHNAVSNVLLPSAFIAQDYSVQIADLRDKRKADSLIKPSRKAKRAAATDSADESDGVVKETAGGKKFLVRSKGKRSAHDASDSDDEPMPARPKKKKVVVAESEQDEEVVKKEKSGPDNSSSEDSEVEDSEVAKSA